MRRSLLSLLISSFLICSINAFGSTTTAPTASTSSKTSYRWELTIDAELNSPIIGALTAGNDWFNTVALAARIGASKNRVGLFVFSEYGHFEEPSYDPHASNTLLSIGGGSTFSYFNNRMRTMVQLGTTILLTESFQNKPGTPGMFIEIRPAGFVIPFKKFNIQIYPITLSWIMPVLKNIPLFYIHYRTAISVGGTF